MKTSIRTFGFILTVVSISLVQGTRAFTIQSKSLDFKGHFISYEEATRVHESQGDSKIIKSVEDPSDPILLLNGFGVGSFHQHRLMPNLISIQENDGVETTRQVYGIDYLDWGRVDLGPLIAMMGILRMSEGSYIPSIFGQSKLSNLLRQLLFLIMVKIRKSI